MKKLFIFLTILFLGSIGYAQTFMLQSGSASPTTSYQDKSISLNVALKADLSISNYNVQVLVTNAFGKSLKTIGFPGTAFTSGVAKTFFTVFPVDTSVAPGTYYAKYQIFNSSMVHVVKPTVFTSFIVREKPSIQLVSAGASPASVPSGMDPLLSVTLKSVNGLQGHVQLMVSNGTTGQVISKDTLTVSNISMLAGESRTFSWKPRIDSTYAAGSYNVKAYVKSTDWATVHFSQLATSFSVTAAPVVDKFDYLGAFPIQNSQFRSGVAVPIGVFMQTNQDSVSICLRVNGASCKGVVPNQQTSLALPIGTHIFDYIITGASTSLTIRKTASVIESFSSNQAPHLEFIFPSTGKINVLGSRPVMVLGSDPEGQMKRVQIRDKDGTALVQAQVAGGSGLKAELASNRLPPSLTNMTLKAFADDLAGKQSEKIVTTLRFEDPNFVIPSRLSLFPEFTVADWNNAFIKGIRAESFLQYDSIKTGEEFAWTASFYLKAYVRMAQLTGSQFYLNKAKTIIDVMFESTDEKKVAKGHLNLKAAGGTPYNTAPPQYLQTAARIAGTPAQGWNRRVASAFGGPSVSVLIDGQICNSIMTYVDAVLSDSRFSAHASNARSYVPKVSAILNDHDASWRNDRTPTIPGSFYYTRNCDPKLPPDECVMDMASSIYSGPTAFNHNATFFTAALLVHKHAPNPGYADRAARVVKFFKNYVRNESGVYFWFYNPGTASPKPEDVDHGHIDVEFLVLAQKMGIGGVTVSDLQSIARTYQQRLYINSLSAYYHMHSLVDAKYYRSVVNGLATTNQPAIVTKDAAPMAFKSVGYGWIDLATYDPVMLNLAVDIYKQNQGVPSDRGFLGWANILLWKAK